MADDGIISGLIFFSSIFAALSYSYFLSSNLPKGVYRLVSLVPIFCLLTVLPLRLSSAFAAGVATFFLTWLANFKLFLFAFDHGPLYPRKSLVLFIMIASFPVKIRSRSVKPKKKKKKLPLNLATESVIFPLLMAFVYEHKQTLNPDFVLIIYCIVMFLLVDLLVFVSNAVIRTVAGIELDPPSNEPYLATSLQDFWGRRWNIPVTNILHHTVYKPVKFVFSGNDWAALPAIFVTFVVSGLMHELLFYSVTHARPTWEMTGFFVLHGICVVLELVMKRKLAGKVELPVIVARLLTVGFVVVTSKWLFFPPLIKGGADAKALEEYKILVDYVKRKTMSR